MSAVFSYTDVVLSFLSFFSETSASSRAKRTRGNERLARKRKIKDFVYFPASSPTTNPLRWRSINLLRFTFYHPRSTDFKEKKRGSVNRLVFSGQCIHFNGTIVKRLLPKFQPSPRVANSQ